MDGKHHQSESEAFRPSDYMRARRPYLFSDTQVIGEPLLDRSFLEYYLETLTNRSQEKDFEHFCRRLAEKEICPNLLPQTGPTGGGDSKVDSETYPVSDAVSIRWYEGTGREAASERWAFAISAKKEWRSKVRSDVRGIIETQRGYALIYFISSQYIKDKDRAKIEDELLKTHKVSIRVLDRTWILEKVFQNKRESLAIETLKISSPLTQSIKKGSLDTTRESELDELETQIQDPTRYQGIEYQLVEDCIEVAKLARELELPRIEVDGRFVRAERVAEKYGTQRQKLQCAYDKAWTSFWWHDDFNTFNQIYDSVECLAVGSNQVTDIELLANLWQLLWTTVKRSKLNSSDAKIDARTETLYIELQRLQADKNRPSTILQSRSIELLMDLSQFHDRTLELKKILSRFREVFKEGKNLVNFPVTSLIKILLELGEYLPDDPDFDELFESVLLLSQERKSRVISGQMLLTRGNQKLINENYYEAIRLLGRAQHDLAMHECRGDLIAALALCAIAYESVGLLWAARSNMLLAASQAINQYWEDGTITIQAFACLQRLIWIELQLGKIPIVLTWIEIVAVIFQVLKCDEKTKNKFLKERKVQDQVLGILLLKATLKDLQNLESIPKILQNLDLNYSYIALLYALGYEDVLRSKGFILQKDNESSVREFFVTWLEQPASNDLPESPELLVEDKVELVSHVLGCKMVVETPNNNRSLFIAESILSSFEAFLATSLNSDLIPHQSNIRFQIVPSNLVSDVIDFQIEEENFTHLGTLIRVQHSIDECYIAGINSEKLNEKLTELVILIVLHIACLPDPEHYFDKLSREESVFSRAFEFNNVANAIWNILGKSPKVRLVDWQLNNLESTFPLRRVVVWNHGSTQTNSDEQITQSNLINSSSYQSKNIPELRKIDSLKHHERKVCSLLDVSLWDKANWKAIGFGIIPIEQNLPLLGFALLFNNESKSKQIFSQWKQEYGNEDIEEKIRISIITGIDAINSSAYRVAIGTNPNEIKVSNQSQLILTRRINTMRPKDSRNLDQFITYYEQIGFYVLIPGYISQDLSKTELFWELGILKRQISIRPAWQIGENDLDLCSIQTDDKIIIPSDIKDPPVIRGLAQIRKMRS